MGLLAIAFSDLHAYKFRQFDVNGSRLNFTLDAFQKIMIEANRLNVPILFAGDLYHTPKEIESETLTKTTDALQCFLKTQMYAISGNHDQNEKNGWDYRSNTYLKMHWATNPKFKLLDYLTQGLEHFNFKDSFLLQGIPYMTSEDETKKAVDAYRKKAKEYKGFKILLMHGDVKGCKDYNEHEMYDGKLFEDGVDIFFKEWDLVLYGHIHRAQKISKKVYMLGSPIHQISSDKGEMGYWQIFNDQDPKFIGLADYPKFIHLGKGEKPLADTGDYYIPFEEEGEPEDMEKGNFNLNVSRTKLATRYMKVKGIKSKIKKKELIHILNSI